MIQGVAAPLQRPLKHRGKSKLFTLLVCQRVRISEGALAAMGYLAKIAFLTAMYCAIATPAAASIFSDVPRTDKPITIDGVMDDDAWSDAIRISLNIETSPGENTAAKVDTVALLIEDGDRKSVV